MDLQSVLILSAVIFSIGLFGALTRSNAIVVLMSLELMFNAVNIALVGFSKYATPMGVELQLGKVLTGQVFALFIIAVAAAEIALGLAIVIAMYRERDTVDIDRADLMRL